MTKTDIVEHLNQAKAAHLRWVQRAHMLIFGFDLDKNAIPVDFTQCNFGQMALWRMSKTMQRR